MIHAKELMLGDWVKKGNLFGRVLDIEQREKYAIVGVEFESGYDVYDEDALSIPERKARDYDDRVGKDELTVILNNSIISGRCVNKIDFIRKTGIAKSSFFYTLKGDRRMSKETSKKVRRFNERRKK